jgi:tripartite ATP-independent transporter DctM subunit
MTWVVDIGLASGVLIALLLGGMWIPFAVSVSAALYLFLHGGMDSFRALGLVSWGSMNSFTLTAIPLYILMAELLLECGLSHRIYRGLSRVVQRLPGGLLQTNIAGCAVFAAISGSSSATAAAIGTVALPRLKERGYDGRLSTGTLAAGGTLGILIPPSIAMIIYGTLTETSIAKLFMAGFVPGIVLAIFFMIYVAGRALANDALAPRERQVMTAAEWAKTCADLVPSFVLIGFIMASLYAGFATPTEAAAVGVCIAAVICLVWGDVNMALFRRAFQKTVRISGAIMFMVYAAYLFSYAVGVAGFANRLSAFFIGLGLSKLMFLVVVVIMYTILGCLIDSIGMMVVTVPWLHPILLKYGIDSIWFGVVLVMLVELGQVTPPVGMNLFVIQRISEERLEDVLAGSVPFFFIFLLMIAVMVMAPDLALWLPSRMAGR